MTEFKVGDKVRATITCFPARKGEIYTLTNKHGTIAIATENSDMICCHDDTWELVESAPKFKYQWKKGDKLKVTDISMNSNLSFKNKTIYSNNDVNTNDSEETIDVMVHGNIHTLWFVKRFKKVEDEGANNKEESSEKETMDIETLKTFSNENLAEGKEMAEDAQASYELKEAQKAYADLVDRRDKQERIIRVAKEELKKIGDDLKVFGK